VQQILRTAAAVTLMLLSACATTTTVDPLSAPIPADARALRSTPPVPVSEEPPRRPAEDTSTTLPSVAAKELIVVPATSEPPSPAPAASTAAPAYYQSFASYYAKRFEGRRTASGERYDPAQMTAATRDFPLQSWLKVINPANGREVIVRVNDRTGKRKTPLVDLSRAAARKLGFLGKGMIRVHVIPLPPTP